MMKSELYQFVSLVVLAGFLLITAYVFYIGSYSVHATMSLKEQDRNDTIENYDDSIHPSSNGGMHMQYLATTNTATTDNVQHQATNDSVTVQNQATTESIQQHQATTDAVRYQATTDAVRYQATTDAVQYQATTDAVRYQATTDAVQYQATTDSVQHRATNDSAQSQIATDPVQHRATTDAVHPTTGPVSQRTRLATSSVPVLPTALCTRYDGASHNFSTQDLIVRAAYFDDRPRGNHRNSTVILIEVRISILKQNLIIGCAVGEHAITNRDKFGVHKLRLTRWVHSHHPELSHDTVFVDCFDLPVQNGSRAFVLYKRSNDNTITCVESERPLMIPAPSRAPAKDHKFSVALCCAPVYGRPPLLTEWLRYQKTLAFDHVHLIAEDSFVKAGGLENKELKQGIQEGFVSVDVWKSWLKRRQVYYHSQVLAHEDCIYRLRGTYDYVMLLDADEFFIPRVVNKKGIHYYVKRCCSYRRCGSCHFHEFMYYPDCGMKGKVGKDGNITSKLVSYKFLDQAAQGKSVHRSTAIVETGCQRGNEYTKGYKSVEFPQYLAYVAHVRKGIKPQEC